MTHPWARLAQLREQQKTLAHEAVARERRAVEESEAVARRAQARLAEEQDAKAALWQDTAASMQGGGFNLAALRHASAWSRALDTRIGHAGERAAQVESVVAARADGLEQRRRELRAAMGELEKVQQMHRHVRREARREGEARIEDTLDDAAVQAWRRRRVP